MEEKWIPSLEEYNPNITKEQWIEFVKDKEIFTENSLITFACIQKSAVATCADMAEEFGRSFNFYNTGNWQTGKRVYKKINCPLSERTEGSERFWSVCCFGRLTDKGRWEFKIRPELQEAFDETGVLEGIEIMGESINYYVISPNIWNDGKFEEYLKYMIKEHCVLMGWDDSTTKGKLFSTLNIGDRIIVAQRQNWKFSYHFIGVISSSKVENYKEAQKRSLDNFTNISNIDCLLEDWTVAGSSQIPAISRIDSNRNPEIIDKIEKILKKGESQMQNDLINETKKLLENTKNLILTGAPGTGKTYLAKQIAKAMGCEDNEIGFVQFHPSYDYTDFVEGLRPVQNDGSNQIGFERMDGVFKKFCAKALEDLQRKSTGSDDSSNFDDAWDALLEEVRENIANGKLTKIGIWDYGLSSTNSLKYESVDTKSKYTFTVTKKNVFDAYRGIKARPSGYFQKYMKDVADYMQKFGLKEYKEQSQPLNTKTKNYVFIIDEINRGEVSKIFGELFYSVDPGYRVSADDLEKAKSDGKTITSIRTQYANMETDGNDFDRALNSKDFGHFFIPENVYIIGTMNDIDRSVESMDFAFRRRFAWKEITADNTQYMLDEVEKDGVIYGLPSEIVDEAKKRMNRLNNAISELPDFNSAYHIGASYFLKLKNYEGDTDNGFQSLWNYHLKGILEEYLRGNPEKTDLMKKLKAAYDGADVTNE